jgi:disulfide oxidoreductase YuzD
VETAQVAAYYLKIRYGEAVRVDYVEMADPKNQSQFPEVMAVVEEQNLPYPLVAINGRLRAAGSAHYYRVVPYVEEALETETVDHQPSNVDR